MIQGAALADTERGDPTSVCGRPVPRLSGANEGLRHGSAMTLYTASTCLHLLGYFGK